jgi:creatinine amidohydrolase
MQWEDLTSPDFEKAVRTCGGVGIIPVGVIEPHSAQLPLGTDTVEAHWTACRAAEQEEAIVLPFYPFGINHESAHLPGSLVIKRDLVLELLENICDEMGRHGLTKIILLSGHGGNRYALPLFVQTLPEKEKPYVVYMANVGHFAGAKEILETTETGHACEAETSTALYINGDHVRMDQVPPEPFTNLRRNKALSDVGAYSPMDWYAMYPTMYVGDASKATAEKGKVLAEARVAGLVELIKAVKQDDVSPGLLEEFLEGKRNPTSPDAWTKPD